MALLSNNNNKNRQVLLERIHVIFIEVRQSITFSRSLFFFFIQKTRHWSHNSHKRKQNGASGSVSHLSGGRERSVHVEQTNRAPVHDKMLMQVAKFLNFLKTENHFKPHTSHAVLFTFCIRVLPNRRPRALSPVSSTTFFNSNLSTLEKFSSSGCFIHQLNTIRIIIILFFVRQTSRRSKINSRHRRSRSTRQ